MTPPAPPTPPTDSERMDWLLAHAHTVFHASYTEGPIMVLSREAIDAAIEEAKEPREEPPA